MLGSRISYLKEKDIISSKYTRPFYSINVRSVRIRGEQRRKEKNSRLQEKMRTGKNEAKVMSITVTIVSLFCTWLGNWQCYHMKFSQKFWTVKYHWPGISKVWNFSFLSSWSPLICCDLNLLLGVNWTS